MKQALGIFLIVAFVVTLVTVQSVPISVATNESQIQQITHDQFNDTAPIIHVDPQNSIHFVWTSWTDNPIYDPLYPISYLTNKGAGETGLIWERLAYKAYKDFAVDSNGIAHVTYCALNDIPGLHSDIVYANLSRGQFHPMENVTYDSANQIENKIAIDLNDKIHVIYTMPPDQIWYVNTLTGWFGTPTTVDPSGKSNSEIAFAVDSNGKAHIAWTKTQGKQSEIYYSNNILGSFIQPINISQAMGVNDSQPAITVDLRNYVHITWVKGTIPSEIYYVLYFPTNGTLRTPINISQTPSWNELHPVICVDSKNVTHIAYEGSTATDSEIFYLNNSKGLFDSPKNITNNAYNDCRPSIAVDSCNNIHLAWESWIDSIANIYYTKLIPRVIRPENGGIPSFELLPVCIVVIALMFRRIQQGKKY